MVPSVSRDGGVSAGRRRSEEFARLARPLIRPSPRGSMFFPLAVLVAVLPGLYALRCWDLNPPGPWWGLRGLAALDGRLLDQVPAASGMGADGRAFAAVAMQPPLYAWLEALALGVGPGRSPLATILPSYLAGVLVVLLVYWHGRLWRGAGPGLMAAALTAFNRDLLVQMQQATPTTLGLAGLLTALLGYARHVEAADGRPRVGWLLLGALGLAVSLLSVGALGLLAVPIVVLHQLTHGPDPWSGPRRWRPSASLVGAGLALIVAIVTVAPWHTMMHRRYGGAFWSALLAPPQAPGVTSGLATRLLDLAPASLALGLFGAARAVRRALVAETDDPGTLGGTFWVAWLAVAALAPAALPAGPRPAMSLFLLVPLNLLAARAMTDLAARRIPARAVTWLAPATAITMAWWFSMDLRGSVAGLVRGERPGPGTALGLHLGLDLVIALAVATRGLDRWSRRRDDRRRLVLGGFLGAVMAVTIASGLREVNFRHRETTDLLALCESILRQHRARPFTVLAVVTPRSASSISADVPPPGGRLRFLLRSTLPDLAQLDLDRPEELLSLPPGRRLVVFAGRAERLAYPLQSRLNLQAIHPGRSGLLDAYATALEGGRGVRR